MVGERWKKKEGRRRSAIRYFKSVEDTSSIGVKETRKVPFSEMKGQRSVLGSQMGNILIFVVRLLRFSNIILNSAWTASMISYSIRSSSSKDRYAPT
jgi:hypothetical protein